MSLLNSQVTGPLGADSHRLETAALHQDLRGDRLARCSRFTFAVFMRARSISVGVVEGDVTARALGPLFLATDRRCLTREPLEKNPTSFPIDSLSMYSTSLLSIAAKPVPGGNPTRLVAFWTHNLR